MELETIVATAGITIMVGTLLYGWVVRPYIMIEKVNKTHSQLMKSVYEMRAKALNDLVLAGKTPDEAKVYLKKCLPFPQLQDIQIKH